LFEFIGEPPTAWGIGRARGLYHRIDSENNIEFEAVEHVFGLLKCNTVPLAKIIENAILRPMATCVVAFVDLDGLRHSVEVQADGLYEAAVLGLAAFKKHDFLPGALTQLEVEVRSSITHTLTVKKVREWLERGVRTPKEAVLKERLRTML
jgi:hypothetical protein